MKSYLVTWSQRNHDKIEVHDKIEGDKIEARL